MIFVISLIVFIVAYKKYVGPNYITIATIGFIFIFFCVGFLINIAILKYHEKNDGVPIFLPIILIPAAFIGPEILIMQIPGMIDNHNRKKNYIKEYQKHRQSLVDAAPEGWEKIYRCHYLGECDGKEKDYIIENIKNNNMPKTYAEINKMIKQFSWKECRKEIYEDIINTLKNSPSDKQKYAATYILANLIKYQGLEKAGIELKYEDTLLMLDVYENADKYKRYEEKEEEGHQTRIDSEEDIRKKKISQNLSLASLYTIMGKFNNEYRQKAVKLYTDIANKSGKGITMLLAIDGILINTKNTNETKEILKELVKKVNSKTFRLSKRDRDPEYFLPTVNSEENKIYGLHYEIIFELWDDIKNENEKIELSPYLMEIIKTIVDYEYYDAPSDLYQYREWVYRQYLKEATNNKKWIEMLNELLKQQHKYKKYEDFFKGEQAAINDDDENAEKYFKNFFSKVENVDDDTEVTYINGITRYWSSIEPIEKNTMLQSKICNMVKNIRELEKKTTK